MLYAAAVEVKIQGDERSAPMVELPEAADRLHPAEALLDQFAFLLTDRIAAMSRRACVDRTAPSRRVLREVGVACIVRSPATKLPIR